MYMYSVWGMHLVWWFFWIALVVMVFGYNVPEKTRVRSGDPLMILKRRRARGELAEDEYNKLKTQLDDAPVPEQRKSVVTPSRTVHAAGGHPLVVGLTLSITWVILYSLCALIYWVSPELILTATSKLFHGLSFTQMAQTASTFSLRDYFAVVAIGAAYSLVAGVIGSSVHTLLLRASESTRQEKRQVPKSQLSQRLR